MAVDDESEAEMASGLMAVPDTSDWSPGLVTVTTLVITQVMLSEPDKAGVVGGRDGHRVAATGGRRAADHSRRGVDGEPGRQGAAVRVGRVAVDDESEAVTGTGVMAVPETSDWSPGPVTDTVLVMVQVKVAEPDSRLHRWP